MEINLCCWFFDAFEANKLNFNKFCEIYLWKYDFKQKEKSLAAHHKSSEAHLRAAAQPLRNTALHQTLFYLTG